MHTRKQESIANAVSILLIVCFVLCAAILIGAANERDFINQQSISITK